MQPVCQRQSLYRSWAPCLIVLPVMLHATGSALPALPVRRIESRGDMREAIRLPPSACQGFCVRAAGRSALQSRSNEPDWHQPVVPFGSRALRGGLVCLNAGLCRGRTRPVFRAWTCAGSCRPGTRGRAEVFFGHRHSFPFALCQNQHCRLLSVPLRTFSGFSDRRCRNWWLRLMSRQPPTRCHGCNPTPCSRQPAQQSCGPSSRPSGTG